MLLKAYQSLYRTGYGAPEFFQGGVVISEKADVFSFGVLVLEIVTGQRSCEPPCHGNPDEEPTLISTVSTSF